MSQVLDGVFNGDTQHVFDEPIGGLFFSVCNYAYRLRGLSSPRAFMAVRFCWSAGHEWRCHERELSGVGFYAQPGVGAREFANAVLGRWRGSLAELAWALGRHKEIELGGSRRGWECVLLLFGVEIDRQP